ncbi:MAG TPA: hypothetical protein PK765_06680 [bacterium]|nr:hypothetical protein [bacterium]
MNPKLEALQTAPQEAPKKDDAQLRAETKEALANYMACMSDMMEFATGEGPLQNRLNAFRAQQNSEAGQRMDKRFWLDPSTQAMLRITLGPDGARQLTADIKNPTKFKEMVSNVLANLETARQDPVKFAEFVSANVNSMCISSRVPNATLEARRRERAGEIGINLDLDEDESSPDTSPTSEESRG